MKPEQEAKELREKFAEKIPYRRERIWGKEVIQGIDWERGKELALICVEEILKAVTTIADKKYDYYIEVKKELLKL